MPSIYNYKKEIMNSNPKQQIIEVSLTSPKWVRLFKNHIVVKEAFDDLHIANGRYVITRDDVFKTQGKTRIIKALAWAFSDNPYMKNIYKILKKIEDIYDLLSKNEDSILQKNDFMKLYGQLDQFPGIDKSTYSILLYFYNIKCEEDDAVAITNHIVPVFKKIDELKGYDNKEYYDQMHQINEIARNVGVKAEWVEYYLYRVHKGEIKL